MAEATNEQNPSTVDFEVIKGQQQQTWASGDYAQVGVTLQIVGERLAEALALHAGQTVLDVAAGNGNFSLSAARRCTRVTSTDFVPALLERGRLRALAEGLDITFRQADAEALPFPDASFDHLGSVFGVMFTPDQVRSAAEMIRVVRPGGRIGLANWTPDGFIGQLFGLIGRYRPNGLPSPALWGTTRHLEHLFGSEAAAMTVQPRQFHFLNDSIEGWLESFRAIYGPVRNAFNALEAPEQAALETATLELLHQFNVAGDGTMKVPADYLEVIITRA
ncbi:MAG: class I SAM-dependent methyltransferase [Pseudomonadota bacterium]